MRLALVYGALGGAVAIGVIIVIVSVSGGDGHLGDSMALGYLVMALAMALVFVGVKRYRDEEHGGVVSFWRAFGMGVAIAAVAAVVYSAIWEVYLALTDYAYIDIYLAKQREALAQAGLDADTTAARAAQIDMAAGVVRNPLLRPLITMTELFPVGLLVALISAALLRNPRFLSAR